LLAAFLDGTVTDYERTAVVTHLTECAECRAVALTVVEFCEVQALDDMWTGRLLPARVEPRRESRWGRWSREKTRAPAAVLVAVVIVAIILIPFSLWPTASPQQALSTLAQTTEGERLLAARLSSARGYAPPAANRQTASSPAPSWRLVSAAARIRDLFGDNYAAPSRRAVGVAALMTGELDEAIVSLEIAVAAAARDADLANDLAAAYFERAERANRPDDLPSALTAVERALRIDPAHRPALFNRALIISALHLDIEAVAAWRAYIAAEPDTAWVREAESRMRGLAARPERAPWTAIRERFETAPDREIANRAVRDYTTASRDLVENALLPRWLAAAVQHDADEEQAVLASMRLLADAFVRHASDRLYLDFVQAVASARRAGEPAFQQFVAAHQHLVSGMALMSAQRFADAASVLRQAVNELTAVRSPFAGRARIEYAATDYYGLRYAAAAQAIPAVKAAAQARGHAILLIRAAWVQGLAAYGRNEFGLARAAYEEMLSLSAASGDTDPWLWANALLASLHETLADSPRAWRYRIDATRRLPEAFGSQTRSSILASASGDALLGEHHAAALLFHGALLASPAALSANLEVQVRSQRARTLFALGRAAEAQAELATARQRLSAVADPQGRLRIEADVLAAEAEVLAKREPARALAAAERALTLPLVQADQLRRARLHLQLAQLLTDAGQLNRAEAAINEGLQSLEGYRARPETEFALRASDPAWRLYAEATRMALRRDDLASAFEYAERGRVRIAQELQVWGRRPASLADVQRALPSGEALVVLTQTGDVLHVWVVRGDRVAAHAVDMSGTRATGLVAAHLHEMARGTAAPTVSGELFDALFRPVAAALADVAQIVLVADAPYNRIAFAGLWDRQRADFLVERFRLVVAPSASAYAWAAAHPRTAAPDPALRRASIVGADGAPGVRSPMDALAEHLVLAYGPERVRRAEVATASRLGLEIATGDVVHVSAPVVANADFPGLSRLVMNDDPGHRYSGAVFSRSVAAAPVHAQLVTLERGANQRLTVRAEGTLGFARGLLAAGVAAVVAPVADLELAPADKTLAEFHRNYAAGASAAESLRRAQLSALDESNHRSGRWATLTVFGSTE
jgi:hypothetical protein